MVVVVSVVVVSAAVTVAVAVAVEVKSSVVDGVPVQEEVASGNLPFGSL